MTRRKLILALTASASAPAFAGERPLLVPVRFIVDGKVKWRPGQIAAFRSGIWAQAVKALMQCGVRIRSTPATGEVLRPPYREPVISGLEIGVLNVVVSDTIPMQWDRGRGLAGVTTLYRGRHLCMVAYNHAHGHRVPFVSVNTCLHELLHALLQDIYEERPAGVSGQAREFRIDYYATLMWLFRGGAGVVRNSAAAYLDRVRAERAPNARVSLLRLNGLQ